MRKSKLKNVIIAWLLVFSMVVPNVSGTMVVGAADTTVKNYDAMTMEEILDSEEPLTWVFAGDSITHNATWTQGMNSYSEWFEQYLYSNEVGRKNDAVINTAWGGATIRDFQTVKNTPPGNHGTNHDAGEGLEKYVLSYKPDVVFIKVGMNDRGMATTTFIEWYTKTIDSIYAAGKADGKIPKIIVLTPTPISGENLYDDIKHKDRGETTVNNAGKTIYYNGTLRFRNALEQFVTDYNSKKNVHMLFCDFRTAFIKEAERLGDDYLSVFFRDPSDGEIHPNAAGQYLMFKTLCQTLKIDNRLEKIFQFNYSDLNWAGLYVDDTDGVDYENGYAAKLYPSDLEVSWAQSITENYVWAIAGAEQMSGYNGLQVNRSLMRQLDNAMRAGAHHPYSQRDIRLVNAAAPGNTIASMIHDYEDIIGKHDADVLLLLPEISHVYASDYVHSEEAVEEYKTSVKSLLAKSEAKVNILWSPLASGDDTINTYINDYAEAARGIAAESSNLLFFDANKFMNENMTNNDSLKRNWFDDEMYITPLAAVDVAIAFYTSMYEEEQLPTDETGTTKGICYSELINHNLRYTTDKRAFKSAFVRDNIDIADTIAVSGTTVTLDVSAIKAAYANADITIKVMPEINAGNYYEGILDLTEVAEVAVDGNVYTFTSPCKFLNLAIYGKQGELVYRFKDISITVEGAADAYPTKPVAPADGAYLTALEVVGAPSIEFDKDTTTYDVNLYQYQQFVRIVAKAHEDLTITVNGEEVESGVNSQMITISEPNKAETVTVKVSGTVNGENAEKTYTLNLSRPEYPDIIVTEVMAYSDSDKYDLVEIYNASGRKLNLADYSIGYKRTYPSESVAGADVSGEDLYYFTGNDQTFGKIYYTGINPITKYSTYWGQEQLTDIPFEKDSTMVIWVKTGNSGTYDDLLNSMKSKPKNMTVEVDGEEQQILPDLDQLVVAEAPSGKTYTHATYAPNSTMDGLEKKFYLAKTGSAVRCWVFMLDKDAQVAENGAITETGDDIISAARFNRVAQDAQGYSDAVMSYNTERGVSLVKDQMNWVDASGGHTTEEQGYGTLTSFGAIEYWQKPVDFSDTEAPVVTNSTPKVAAIGTETSIAVTVSDDKDLRYVAIYAKQEGETEWSKVVYDLVLESTAINAGKAIAMTDEKTVSMDLGELQGKTEYYIIASDGANTVEIGSADNPEEIKIPGGGEVEVNGNVVVQEYTDISAFRVKDDFKAPVTPDGYSEYLFAGWYTNKACTTPLDAALTSEDINPETTYYAKFVAKEILGVRVQVSNDTSYTKDTTNSRFVTAVDTLKYKAVGFDVVHNGKKYHGESNQVYSKLYAMDSTENVMDTYYPNKVFHKDAKYFMAVKLSGIEHIAYGEAIEITPYWITLDGTKVCADTVNKTVNEAYTKKTTTVFTTKLEDNFIDTALQGATDSVLNTDLTYASDAAKNGVIVVANGAKISFVDPDTMTVIDPNTIQNLDGTAVTWDTRVVTTSANDITLNTTHFGAQGIKAIEYNALYNKYVVGIGQTNKEFRFLNADFSLAGDMHDSLGLTNKLTMQGAGSDDKYIYFMLSNVNGADTDYAGHAIMVCDWNGNFIKTIRVSGDATEGIPTSVGVTGIRVSDNQFYITSASGATEAVYQVSSENWEIEKYEAYIGDTGYVTLKEAAAAAEKDDTIRITGEYIEISDAVELEADNVTMQTASGKNVIIKRGAGNVDLLVNNTANNVTIKSGEKGALIFTGAGYKGGSYIENAGELTLSGVQFIDILSNAAGAVHNVDGTLTVDGATFNGNQATKAGGAIFVEKGNLTVDDSVFEENTTAQTGGAIHFNNGAGTLTIKASTFANNTATGNGGAISNYGKKATLTDCVIDNNHSSANGGGFYTGSYSEVIFTKTANGNASVSGNTATGWGGGIGVGTGKFTVTGYTFEDNSAKTGGAIRHNGVEGEETESLTVKDSTFVKNASTASDGGGGAIYARPNVTVIEGCIMTENTAVNMGGAISTEGTVKAGRISDTNINYNTAAHGGAMTIATGSKITLTDCDFSNNNGTYKENLAELQGTDIRLGGATSEVTLAGKVVGKIYSRNTSVINVVDALSEESDVELDWYPRTETTWEPAVTEKVIEFFETSGDELVANTDAEEVKLNQDCIRIGQRITNKNWVFAYDGTIGKLATRTEENVAEVDGTKYTTLKDAVAAAAASSTQPGVVKLIAENPIMVDSPISIPAGKKVTITDNGTRQEIRRAVPTTVPTKFCLFDIATTGTLNVISTSDDINNPRIIVNGASDVIRNTTKSSGGAWSLFQMGLKSTDSCTAKLTISGGVKLVDNYSAYEGSVISNYYGGSGASFSEVTLDKILVSNNYTTLHGTIFIYRTQSGIKVTNSNFINNTAQTGGAMWLDPKQVEIDNCDFMYNTATGDGGALRTASSLGRTKGYTATIKNSNFVGNTAATQGGAISMKPNNNSDKNGVLTVDNLVFRSNSAATGKDVYMSSTTKGTYKLSEMKVSGKFVGSLYMAGTNKLQVIGTLTSGSSIELDWHTPAILTGAVTFSNADIMNASKAYIKLGSKMTGYRLVEGTNALNLQK